MGTISIITACFI